MSTDYKPAQWIPTSHYWAGRGGHAPKWIIIHGTAGGTSAQAVAYYFQTDDPPTSAHYVVGLEGEIVQCVAEANSAWANGVVTQGHDPWWSPQLNPNFLTFSIEHVKPATDNSSQLTDKQKQASFALIEHLCDTYNIPKREADANGGITGHYSIDPVNRSRCPGTFPWGDLWTYLSGGGNPMGVPAGWKDDGATLTAPNSKKVLNGFRWYVLNNGWDPNNWPLESEYYEQVIDVTNPKLGSGTVQHFRKSILAWQEGTSDVLDLWSGAIAQTWQQRALACEQSHAGVGTTPPQPGATSAAPVVTTRSANAPDRTPAPMGYIPPLSAMQRQASLAPAKTATPAAPGGGSNGQD
ncbi:MAG: N-acetylmuramoyl-L-alanine amidase, partial [Ktedonobacterales bacterium]